MTAENVKPSVKAVVEVLRREEREANNKAFHLEQEADRLQAEAAEASKRAFALRTHAHAMKDAASKMETGI